MDGMAREHTLQAETSAAGISTQQGVPMGGGVHFSASDMIGQFLEFRYRKMVKLRKSSGRRLKEGRKAREGGNKCGL